MLPRFDARHEAGLTTTQVAVLVPSLLLWIMLIVQYGLWIHAKQVATAAAAEGVDAAQILDAGAIDGEAAARGFLDQAGNLEDVEVSVERSGDAVVVQVRGDAPVLVPGFAWSVTARAEGPVERFIPETER